MQKTKLLVLKKLEDWVSHLQPSLRNFPKAVRFTLAQRLENTSFECIDHVVQANLDKPRRLEHLFRARICAERLQVLIRVAHAQSWIDLKHYELYSEYLVEIAKMLAGWARVTQK
jgi:hypothetical protein